LWENSPQAKPQGTTTKLRLLVLLLNLEIEWLLLADPMFHKVWE
jgi:hypothetical protein